jgi:hypothetical protein
MRLKITMIDRNSGEKPFSGVLMHASGEKTCLRSLAQALEAAKAECNAEANRNGKRLSDYDLKVSLQ